MARMTYLLTERPITPDTHVVGVGGEFDMGVAPEVQTTVDRLIDGGVSNLIIDLGDATFIDSAAIGVLVATTKRLRRDGGSLEIVCDEPNLLRIFEIVGLDRLLSIRGREPG
jgi:anti-sigma B factor antagonist